MLRIRLIYLSSFLLLVSCKKDCDCPNSPDDFLKKDLVAYYPFNGNTNDESGNSNHGAATGGALTTDKDGVINKAFNFDGYSFIKVPNSTSLSGIGDNFTITAWVNNQHQFVSVVCKAAFNGPTMQFRFVSDIAIFFANNGKAADFATSLNPVNSWKHIAVTSDGTNAKYYLNGSFHSSMLFHDDQSAADHTTAMYLGADTHGITEMYSGKLDEIRIYKRELSAAEIEKLYEKH